MKYYTAWGRHNEVIISENSLEDNPLVAFEFGEVEADNKYEAEQKAKEIFTKRVSEINQKEDCDD